MIAGQSVVKETNVGVILVIDVLSIIDYRRNYMETNDFGTWMYHDGPIDLDDWVGFVYLIEEIDTEMSYIGIKRFWKTIKRPPLKGKKNKRHEKVESDWRTYNSSSTLMQEKLEKNPGNYEKVILKLCNSVSELKVYEAHSLLSLYVEGMWSRVYNEVVNLRVRLRK